MIYRLLVVAVTMLMTGHALAEKLTVMTVAPQIRQFIGPAVPNGMPNSIPENEQEKSRITLVKDAGQYRWLSRGDIPVTKVNSGEVNIFVALGGQGYVEITPTGQSQCVYLVKEHVRNVRMDITYWGCTEQFNP
ncbi:hypothetical protein N9J36_04610 [Litoricola sp.]|nr:hypothetical protein [Litorivicinus sp.]